MHAELESNGVWLSIEDLGRPVETCIAPSYDTLEPIEVSEPAMTCGVVGEVSLGGSGGCRISPLGMRLEQVGCGNPKHILVKSIGQSGPIFFDPGVLIECPAIVARRCVTSAACVGHGLAAPIHGIRIKVGLTKD